MLYAIISEDHEQTLAARQRVRPAHLERLKSLASEGRLVLAGPHPAIDCEDPGTEGFTGSLIVAAFESWEAAEIWAQAAQQPVSDRHGEQPVGWQLPGSRASQQNDQPRQKEAQGE